MKLPKAAGQIEQRHLDICRAEYFGCPDKGVNGLKGSDSI